MKETEKLTADRLALILHTIVERIIDNEMNCPICGHSHCCGVDRNDIITLFNLLRKYIK